MTSVEPSIITIPEGYISDYIDGKFRKDTPEEYVRQNIEKRLVVEHSYSPNQISVEVPIKLGSGTKKIDLAIYPDIEKKKQENIEIIIECKKEKIVPSDRKDGVDQLKSYMAACLNCEWGLWTNGKAKLVYRKIKRIDNKIEFEDYNDIPSKDRSISEIDRPTRESLKLATEDNLLFAFKTCHNYIYVNDGLQKPDAFFELLKIIFCKIYDERQIPNPLEFYSTSKEKLTSDGRLTVKNRITKIFNRVKGKFPSIFDKNEEIKLKPISLAYIVGELQKYSLLDTYVDVKGKAYEEIVGANLRGDRGEFFTPRNIVRMTVDMLDIPTELKILDPACGTGGFLVIAMNNVIKRLKEEMTKVSGKNEEQWTSMQRENLQNRIKDIAEKNFFGFDINPSLVKATKMNMVMNNDGSGNIFQNDSLQPPHEWSDEVKDMLCNTFELEKGSIRNVKDLALFDIVTTNPPFGSNLPINDQKILEQFDLGHIWKKNTNGKLYKTDKLVKSRAPEVLFIERCLQLLKPGGRMGIVLPDAILGAPGIEYACIREWLMQKSRIIASIDLHKDAFSPKNHTKTSVLILQKKTDEEIRREIEKSTIVNYNIFFAIADKIGHNKRGHTIYKQDQDGNDILIPDTQKTQSDSDMSITEVQMPKKRIVDDQTNVIGEIFLKWKRKEGIPW